MGDAEEFDPYTEREKIVQHPTTNLETFGHMLKGIMGTGMLAVPKAFQQAGLVTGTIIQILLALFLTYCLKKLVDTQIEICRRLRVPFLKYPEAMKAALEMGPMWLRRFAKYMPLTIDTFIVLCQVGVCSVYLVFVCQNTKYILDLWTKYPLSLQTYMLILLVPCILIIFIRDLKYLAPFSLVATAAQLIVSGVIMFFMFQGLPDIDEASNWGKPAEYPLYFGTVIFSFLAIGVVVSAENNMKTPRSFNTVMYIVMAIVTVLQTIFGFFGYWRYLDAIKAVITLNLDKNLIVVQIVILAFAAVMFVSFGLNGYVGFEIIWFNYKKNMLSKSEHIIFWEYLTRIEWVVGVFIFSVAIPILGTIISLVGSVALASLGIIFPAVMEICVLYPDYGKLKWGLVKNIFVLLIGFTAFISGTYSCIEDIILSMRKV